MCSVNIQDFYKFARLGLSEAPARFVVRLIKLRAMDLKVPDVRVAAKAECGSILQVSALMAHHALKGSAKGLSGQGLACRTTWFLKRVTASTLDQPSSRSSRTR
jgi:hypothetical protein